MLGRKLPAAPIEHAGEIDACARWADADALVAQHANAEALDFPDNRLDTVSRSELSRAIDGAQSTLKGVLVKARFWETFAATPLNERQRKVVNRLLDGFEGKLTTSKYTKLTGCSHDTALRDILSLVERGILVQGDAGGRSSEE